MATAGTVILESKIAAEIVLAEDGKYYVDASATNPGENVSKWTDGPFDTEVKARDAEPVIEKLYSHQVFDRNTPYSSGRLCNRSYRHSRRCRVLPPTPAQRRPGPIRACANR
jgi:hypothetical protein